MKKLRRAASRPKNTEPLSKLLEKIERRRVACSVADCHYVGEGAYWQ